MDKNYLYAVANIRANELSLLSRADIDALIDAPDYKTALTLLDGKGYDTSFGSDYSAMLDGETEKNVVADKVGRTECRGSRYIYCKKRFSEFKSGAQERKNGR